MRIRVINLAHQNLETLFQLGPVGHLVIFFWSLSMVMCMPVAKLPWAAGCCLIIAMLIYSHSFRRILRLRNLVLLTLLVLPPLLLLGEKDHVFLGVAYSIEGIWVALQVGLRFVVVLTAVDGFTQSVDITRIASMLERLGLRGLGFSLGVALNLLPSLQESSMHAWQSLRMRGGFRKKKWRGLKLLIVTIVTNALRRAEEIALAAESRAFSPDHCQPAPFKTSFLDRWLLPAGGMLIFIFLLLP